jgi:hypothetical protein
MNGIKALGAVLVLALVAAAGHPSVAEAGVCGWQMQQTINTDPDPKDVKDKSSSNTSLWTSSHESWVLDKTVSAPEWAPEWAWRYVLDSDPWEISAKCKGYSGTWGFTSVSDSSTGAGQWVIARITTCASPLEDIEVHVRQQFHAEAALDGDEKCEVRGVLKFWCARTKSARNPPGTINSVAAGGVSIDDDYDAEDTSIGVDWGGLKFSLVAGTGGSDTDDPEGHDHGNRGGSPEVISTSTMVAMTMDLDSYDRCYGDINNVWWKVAVDCTCDGACKRIQRIMSKNTYPAPPPAPPPPAPRGSK